MKLDISLKILQRKTVTITLRELEQLCNTTEYSALVSEIKSLVESGLIRAMGKETNGMVPPLKSRYKIIRPAESTANYSNEILRLRPEFNPSGYLSNIQLYIKHRELLRALSDYARYRGVQLDSSMSKNERSYDIWGDEKQLDDALCKSMLRFIGWDDKLNYYETPEPFFDYLCNGSNTETILILENKDTWFSLRKLFMQRGKTTRVLYGKQIDGLLYGEGKKISRLNALENYGREVFTNRPLFYYWGDLDYEGIRIFLALSLTHPVELFVPGYLAMLENSEEKAPTECKTAQIQPPDIDRFLELFEHSTAVQIRELLESGKYIPQEICNYPRLEEALSVMK